MERRSSAVLYRLTVRYVSTRGQAPALGFCDTLLAGLAADGGLYVPERWPSLPPIRAGETYASVAAGVVGVVRGRRARA